MTYRDLAFEIIEKYNTRKYTQEDLSKEYKIPLYLIQRLTQQFGYEHTIQKGLQKIVIEGDMVDYLKPYAK